MFLSYRRVVQIALAGSLWVGSLSAGAESPPIETAPEIPAVPTSLEAAATYLVQRVPSPATCSVIRKRLQYQFMRRAELGGVMKDLKRRGFRMSRWERDALHSLMARALPDVPELDDTLVEATAKWDLSGLPSESLQLIEENFVSLSKAYTGPGLDWEDPNGFLPEGIRITYETSTRVLKLETTVSQADVCLTSAPFRLKIGEGQDVPELIGQWTNL